MTTIKKSYEEVLNKSMRIIREESLSSDAVIILFDRASGECKMKTLRGDVTHIHRLLEPVVRGLAAQGKRSQIILPN